MSEQPPGPDVHDPDGFYTDAKMREVYRCAYRLVVALVTARDDKDVRRRLIQLAIDDMPRGSAKDAAALASMLATAVSMLAEYVRAAAAAFDEATHEGAFNEQHTATIRTELLED